MINSTQTIRLLSINEAFDSQGVKIVYGECTFSYYSRNGVVEDTIAYRTKGAAAVSIAELGVNTTGIAIGYLDLNVVDTGKGYKEKKTTLVIRNFICTTSSNQTHTPTVTPVIQPPTPQENTPQLVGVGVATASQNGHSPNTHISDIPF